MGRYYALHDKEDAAVADAVRDHYKPVGPSDVVPSDKVAIAVALADKLDQLIGFFLANEKPSGSGDPYALRRAALGVIRIVLGNQVRISLLHLFSNPVALIRRIHMLDTIESGPIRAQIIEQESARLKSELLSFLADRLKVALKEKGVRHELIDAVFSLGHEDDLVRLADRVEALQIFLKDDDGANLLAAYKRATNILKIEEKKDGRKYESQPDPHLMRDTEEKHLWVSLQAAQQDVASSIRQEEFVKAMAELSGLRQPVDTFFEKVKVNVEDEKGAVRRNRLNLLSSLRATLHQVADFSRIEG
jgi:glycyl-tRNA synthetase beta chain